MNVVNLLRDLLVSGVVGALLLFFLLKVVKISKGWAWSIAVTLTVIAIACFLSPDIAFITGKTRFFLILLSGIMGIAVLFYLGLGLGLVCVVSVVWWLLTRDPKNHSERAASDDPEYRRLDQLRLKVVRIASVVAVVASLVVSGSGFVVAQQPKVDAISLSFSDLPQAFDGLTIALVADLHISGMTRGSFLPMVVDQVNAAQPDLIVLAGDIVDGYPAQMGSRLAALKQLSAPYGVVVTTGNHEFYSDPQAWMDYFSSTLGLTVLDNDGILLQRGSATIEILGINDHSGKGALSPNLPLALSRTDAPAGTFAILVAHQPIQATSHNGQAGQLGIDLQLSGHTHGGQIWPLNYFVRLSQPAVDGVHVIDGVTVVTSRGVGTWRPPIRVGADPEIPLITLHRG